MTAGIEGRALVMFCDQAEIWWLRLLRPGFRHCFVAVAAADGWVVVDPLSHCTAVNVIPTRADVDLAAHYRAHGLTVVEAMRQAAPRRLAPLRPYTCVEAVKRILGIHARTVLTPWQLFAHLNKTRKSLTGGET